MTLFRNKYRMESIRAQWWDYSSNGSYFITICTKDREHFFGRIRDGEMRLSQIGEIVKQEWLKTPAIRSDMHLELGAFVVMPNHFHGIIQIGNNSFNNGMNTRRDAMHGVSTNPNRFGPQSKNLGSIIRGFKSAVTMKSRTINPDFSWQSRYHECIIRNDQSLRKIADYIDNNPHNWPQDRFCNGK